MSASELRSASIASALSEIGELQVVVVAEGEGGVSPSREYSVSHCCEARAIRDMSWLGRLKRLTTIHHEFPHGLAVSPADGASVVASASEADLIWFFKLRTANYFSHWTWQRSVVDIDDVPSTFESSILEQDVPLRQRCEAYVRYRRWRRRERLLGDRFNVIAVCSDADKAYLEEMGITVPVHVIANGFQRPSGELCRRVAYPPRFGFIGVFDHQPNVEGISWFVRECWPKIKQELPHARLRLMGRYTDGPLSPAGADIDALGWVPDANMEMSTWTATVVPVLTGAGTRGKIAHAFSQKCPVISTTLGAHGYNPRHEQDSLIADSSEQFADCCVRAVEEPQLMNAMAERAWSRFLASWSWDVVRPRVWAAAEDCLRLARPSRRLR